jgi:DEAD/DEAH box helicase domain-containing protein
MSIEFALDRLLVQDEFRRHLTLDHTVPARPARYASFPGALDPRLAEALAARGISRLYTPQAEAAALAVAGKDLVVVTPTASGKTACYNLPVLQGCSAIPKPVRSICFQPRRWPRISSPSCTGWSAP